MAALRKSSKGLLVDAALSTILIKPRAPTAANDMAPQTIAADSETLGAK